MTDLTYKRPINKKLMLLIRLVLFVLGATIGFFAIWQVLNERPEFAKKLIVKIIFYISSSLVPAFVLMLSAKPVYLLLRAIIEKMRKNENSIQANDIASFLFGTLVGLAAGFLSEALFRLFLPILALRTFIDVLVGIMFAYGAVIITLKWLRKTESVAEPKEDKTIDFKGYLLSASVFKSEKILSLCSQWLIGKKYLTDFDLSTLEQEGDELAIRNLQALRDKNILSIIDVPEFEKEKAAIDLKLKIVVLSKAEAKGYGEDVEVLAVEEF